MVPEKESIIIADSQYLIRFALKRVVSQLPHLELIGEATSTEELLQLIQAKAPKIVMMDYYEDGFQLDAVKQVMEISPQSRIIIVSADDNKKNIFQTLEWGINAFLTKSCDEDEIIDAIKAAINNDKYFCTKVLDYLLEKSFNKGQESNTSPLTIREIEIVQLIAKGLVAKEIAALLNLSPHTIYTHRKKIMKKLALKSSSELVMYAVNRGLVAND